MKNLKMMAIFCVVLLLAVPCHGTFTELTDDDLDSDDLDLDLDSGNGNYGASFVIDEIVQISALTRINQFGGATVGTIYLDENKGFGVQRLDGGGSEGISGKGGDQDEALVFNFSTAQNASIVVGLYGYEENKDDTIITLLLSDGDEQVFTKSHQNWSQATTSSGKKKVTMDIGLLVGQGFGGMISKLSVAETGGHIYVNSFAYGTNVPEPATTFMLGMGGVVLLRLKRK